MIVKGPLTSISLAILAVVTSAAPTSPLNARDASSSNGTSNNGLTDKVSWDGYSIYINNEPLTLLSGEFHYYRLPSPDLWTDIMQKYKALGFNGASFYFNWGYHSPKRGVYDFEGVRDVQKALDAAKASGIHVISRPGPYINAEVDCGGFPSWLMNIQSTTRQNSPEYEAAWSEWLTAIDKKYLVPNQITEGGPIIMQQVENEYSSNVSKEYMQAIIDKYKKDGIVVPTSFNEINNHSQNFINGTGAVDLYGWDNYPAGFDCSHPSKWGTDAIKTYREQHMKVNPDKPQALYEFQGGSFDPWGGPGYDNCRTMVNEKYAKIYYKNNLAQGVRIQSLYMGYGGTSWGGLATPSVYTSYDYGAPISEPGLMTPKGYEHKIQATFVHTLTKDITATTPFDVDGDNDALVYNGLQSVHSDTQFIIVQHNKSDSDNRDEFTVPINTKDGSFTLPRNSTLVLNGRDAKILVADYDFESQHLVYSTSEIFTHQSLGKMDVIVVYAYEGEDGEFALKAANGSAKATDGDITTSSADGVLQINYKHPNGTMPIEVTGAGDKDLLLLVAGYNSATRWWAPEVSARERVLIQGPYLVRDAKVSGSTLSFTGDIDATTDILVVAPDNVRSFRWNNKSVKLQKQSNGIWKGTLTFDKPNIQITDLSKATWKYKAGSPETAPDFDDSTWMVADHQDTNATVAPETKPVLYADDYGFHTGNLWFRGTFKGSSDITGLNVTAYSGDGSAWVAWLNGKYLGGYDVGSQVFKDLDLTDDDNVLSLLLWTTGHEEDGTKDDRFKSPRGFTKVETLGSNTTISWKVQGNLGGEDLADPVRGAYNEGGLYGEREGWHLPGFDDGDWESATIPDDKNRTGVSWFRTTFKADVPKGYDAPLGLTFEDKSEQRYRALVFVNGWQLGRYANDLGPQKTYYLPEGIVNVNNGENTLAVAVIPLDESSQIGTLSLEPYLVLESGKPNVGLVDSPKYSKRK
ncbi:glycoside hydrolase superfamily [Syncephalastrum racemosum]|uniref:Beta-galactosidase n=1 Tax=Syncephalastrum racemosum TaxID=13706 RepID=A0A1X2HWS5_SYNRA|nr:glycoside hydrolase superfamily [Syncephalastrum racemosum]